MAQLCRHCTLTCFNKRKVQKRTATEKQAPSIHEEANGGEGEVEPGAHMDVLPNELLAKILCQHLDPLWHPVCKGVCRRWRSLLLYVCASSLSPHDFAAKLALGGHGDVRPLQHLQMAS